MRICCINLGALGAISEPHKHLGVGGEEVQHCELSRALARQGHAITLITADHGQGETTIDGVRLLPMRGTFGFIRALHRAQAQIYYYSCAGRLLGLLALYCKVVKRRCVFRVASDADCDPKRVEVRRPWDRWLYHWGLHHADAILVQTEHQRVMLREKHGLRSELAGMLVARPAIDYDSSDFWLQGAVDAITGTASTRQEVETMSPVFDAGVDDDGPVPVVTLSRWDGGRFVEQERWA